MSDQYTMQDPRKQYPVMEIPAQLQSEPGLDAKLIPKADHGDTSYRGSERLKGRKALITGGDSGIGRAVAIAFAREGADVVINYLPDEEVDAKETIRICGAAGVKAEGYAGDISSEKFCEKLIQETVTLLGGIDILVNNAAKQVFIPKIEDLSTEQLVKTFETNIFAMFWLVKFSSPHLKPGASIINTTSIQSYQPSSGLLDYASTKGAITTFTKGLSAQFAEKGVRVNAVAPGPIWTPLQPSYGQPQEKITSFGQSAPLGRAGQPAELAPAYVYLASQESSYVTGEILGVTGGSFL